MQSMVPMLSGSSLIDLTIAPHFLWMMLALFVVASVALVVSALRAQHRPRLDAARERHARRPMHPAVARRIERPMAA